MNDSMLKIHDDSINWWQDLDDHEQQILIIELYCKQNNIQLE